jgi:epoxyqueuosine reductase
MSLTSAAIKARALSIGFDVCGVAPAAAFSELRFLSDWLEHGYAGEMRYLERGAERRADVRNVLPSARSVIVAGMVYNTDRPYSTEVTSTTTAEVSRYAWGEDYHDVMRNMLRDLLEWMRARSDAPFDARCYVDTGPVQERVYAQYAGLGWIGKNTCLINPDLGSWLFLSEIIVSLALEADEAGCDRCATCTLCLDACPTGALVGPGVLDATRCISYLTIELKGAIPDGHRDAVGRHVYGCDICQEVCPWNLRPAVSGRPEWRPRALFDRAELAALWHASDEQLRSALRGSAMTRAKLTGLRRNLALAIGNSGDPGLAGAFDDSGEELEASPSKRDPVVQEHVQWAKRKLHLEHDDSVDSGPGPGPVEPGRNVRGTGNCGQLTD